MKIFFSFLHKLCEVHVVMNIITIIAIAQFFTDIKLWPAFIVVYSVIAPFVSITRAAYFVMSKKPDIEFKKFISMIEGRR